MRKVFFLCGAFSLLLAWASPFPFISRQTFSGHMIMHMLVVAVAAPFLALGVSGSKFDPTTAHPLLFAPIPASIGELIIVWGWHVPSLHLFARHSESGIFLEQLSFIIASTWVWVACFGGKYSSVRGAGIIGLLLTSMHMTFLGALLSLATRPLYGHHPSYGNLSVMVDQQLGGTIMLVVGGVSYLSGGLWLTFKLLREKGRINEKLA